MDRRSKYIWWLVSANVACLAVGLLMQYYCTTTSALRSATEQAWSDLEADAGLWLARFRASSPDAAAAGTPTLDRAGGLMAVAGPARNGVILLDRQWRVITQNPGVQSGLPPYELGSALRWQALDAKPEETTRPVRGELAAPDGPHLALACRLGGGEGFVVVHQPLRVVEAQSAVMLRSLPVINVMTLVWTCVPVSIAVYVLLTRMYGRIASERDRSGADVLRQAQALVRTRDAIIFGLARLAESRDPETGAHLERISAYSTALATALRRHPKFHDQITPAFLRLIGISSALHDIGKVGIEDSILLRPGPLSDSQRTRMRVHTVIGGRCLEEIEQRLGNSNFLQMAREIAFAHHEHWDGSGYPRGLVGAAIPLAARIVALADEYDALSSRRVYKEAFSLDRSAGLIRAQAGRRLDPDIVEVWSEIEPEFRRIARQYAAARPEIPGLRAEHRGSLPITEVGSEAELLIAAGNTVAEDVLS